MVYSKQIDFPEFLMLMTGYEDTDISEESNDSGSRSARLLKEREEELCDMFMMFDKDKSGTISVDELSKVMVTFGGLDKDELDIMINEADKDNDGQVISKDEKFLVIFLRKQLYND